jgi:hypothetical protein
LSHRSGHGAHGNGGLHAGRDRIDPRRKGQQLDSLLRITDRVRGVEAGDLRLRRRLSEGFLDFRLFGARVAVCFGGLSVELFGCELQVVVISIGMLLGLMRFA